MAYVRHTPKHPVMNELQQIRGIGPAVEHRLRQKGIFTLDQFAKLTTDKMANLLQDIPGMSVKRIIKMKWLDQAKKLSHQRKDPSPLSLGQNRQRSALFSIDILIDPHSHVRRTHILHIQSTQEETWNEWNSEELQRFIFRSAKIKPLQNRNKVIKESVHTEQFTSSVKIEKSLYGELRITGIEVMPYQGEGTVRHVPLFEPFDVCITLDAEKTNLLPDVPMEYYSVIQVKNLANGIRQKIGDKAGIFKSSNLSPIIVRCCNLPQGVYRLDASVSLANNLNCPEPNSQLTATTEGEIFRVF